MVSKRIKALLLTAILLVLASMSVHAATDTNDLWDQYNKNEGQVIGVLKDLVKKFFEYFWGTLGGIFADALNTMITPFKAMILWNPDVSALSGFVRALTQLLVPVYIFLIILTGIYFIFISISPSERAKAKSMLQKLVLGMILVSLSMPIYKILLAVSGALSERLLAGADFNSSALLSFIKVAVPTDGNAASLAVGGLVGFTPIAIFFMSISMYLTLVVLAAIVVAWRNFVVYLMAALFPLTLFFYFFDYTKGIGQKMWKYTIMAIFTQVIQAFVFAVAILAVNSAGTSDNWVDSYIMLLVGEGGFFMIIMAPLIMMDILPWIGAALAMVGMVLAFVPGYNVVGGVMVAAGGVMGGMGAGSLMAGGTTAGLGGAHSQSVINAMAARQQQQQGAPGGGGGHDTGGHDSGGGGGGHVLRAMAKAAQEAEAAPAPTGFFGKASAAVGNAYREKVKPAYEDYVQPTAQVVGKTAIGTAVMPPVGIAYGAYKGVRAGVNLAAKTKTGQDVANWAKETNFGKTLIGAKTIYEDRVDDHTLGGVYKDKQTGQYKTVLSREERDRLREEGRKHGRYGGGGDSK